MKKIVFVLAVLILTAPVFATSWGVTPTRVDTDTLSIIVQPATGAKWNDLKVPCNSGDTAASFTVDAPPTDVKWEVDKVEKVGQRHYVVLKYDDYNTEKGGSDTIELTGPANRTGTGSYIVTLNGSPVYSGARGPGFCSSGIDIMAVADGNEVTIGWVNGEPNNVRAFALDITVTKDVNVASVSEPNANYWVHPGTIIIIDGEVNVVGTLVAPYDDLPGDTQPGLGNSGITAEMGSLYDGDANAPMDNGVLFKFMTDALVNCSVGIAENVSRGGVVMENPDQSIGLSFTGADVIGCMGDLNNDDWNSPHDIDALVDILIPYAGAPDYYWVWKDDPNYSLAGDVTGDDWNSPHDIDALVDIILPYAGAPNYYWVDCQVYTAPPE